MNAWSFANQAAPQTPTIRTSLRFDDQIAERAVGRRVFELQDATERNLRDDAGAKRYLRLAHACHTLPFDDDQHLGELLLLVRAHRASALELTREDRAERRRGLDVAEVPYSHHAAAPEQALATIVGARSVPHGGAPIGRSPALRKVG
jgi:hypothetical protein